MLTWLPATRAYSGGCVDVSNANKSQRASPVKVPGHRSRWRTWICRGLVNGLFFLRLRRPRLKVITFDELTLWKWGVKSATIYFITQYISGWDFQNKMTFLYTRVIPTEVTIHIVLREHIYTVDAHLFANILIVPMGVNVTLQDVYNPTTLNIHWWYYFASTY